MTTICPQCLTRYAEGFGHCPEDGVATQALGGADAQGYRAPLIGQLISDRYLILDVVGRGGMGGVYRAWQRSTARAVAIKTVLTGGPATATLTKRFEREARLTAGLKSPHTVTVYDFGAMDDGTLYVAMELLDGVALDDRLAQAGALPLATVRDVGMQVCRSLAEAHAAGIVHRDLKPGNIILGKAPTGEDFVTVLDFGIAKILGDHTTDITATGAAVGSPSYMSPEQIDGRDISARSDLYSLGVTLWDLAAGEPPFQAQTRVALIFKRLTEPPPALVPLRGDRADVRALGDVLARCMAKSPEDRYASAEMLYRALERLPLAPSDTDSFAASVAPRGSDTPGAGAPSGLADTVDNTAPRATPERLPAAWPSPAPPTRRLFQLWKIFAAIAALLLLVSVVTSVGPQADDENPGQADAAPQSAQAPPTRPAAGVDVRVEVTGRASGEETEGIGEAADVTSGGASDSAPGDAGPSSPGTRDALASALTVARDSDAASPATGAATDTDKATTPSPSHPSPSPSPSQPGITPFASR